MLCKAFTYRDPPYETAELERSLRLLEKFELVCQGDDFADPECMATNSEALMYARARAVALLPVTRVPHGRERRMRQCC